MARMTDIDALLEKVVKIQASGGNLEKRVGEIIQAITKAPTVELVRCKNCEHRTDGLCPMDRMDVPWIGTKSTDFCSYGEERAADGI
jgi:hypothetical protein